MNNKRGFVHIVVVIAITLVAALMVAAAWYFEKNKETTNTKTANVNTANKMLNKGNANENLNINTVSINTSDWQTYTNEEYGINFKYPKDWTLEEQSGDNFDKSVVTITSPVVQKAINNTNGKCQSCGPIISFYYYPSVLEIPENALNKLGAKTLEEYFDRSTTIKRLGVRTINTQEAIAVQEGGYGIYYVLYIQNDSGGIYKIFVNDWGLQEGQPTPEEDAVIMTFNLI